MGVSTNAESGGQNLRYLGGSWWDASASAWASASLVGSDWLAGGAGRAEEWTEAIWHRNNSPDLCDGVPESELARNTYRSGWVVWRDVSAAQKKWGGEREEREEGEQAVKRFSLPPRSMPTPRTLATPRPCRRRNPCPCTSSWSSHVIQTLHSVKMN